MAGNSLTLAWNLLATDSASPAFERVGAAADKAAASTEVAAKKTEAAGLSMSKLAAVGAAAGLAFAGAAVKMAAEFQKQMLLVQTQAGASAQEVRNMTPAILSLSGKVAQAPEELATSLYHVESTGLRGKAALEAVKIAAEGAAVGHADLEETTNALTATLASGMVPATESFSQAMGQLNTIVGSGDMKLSDLNEALGTGVLVTTKQYGITLNDVGAALADFGDNNIRGADAATSLRMAVQAIAKPGIDAEGALGRIGLTVQKLQSDEQTGGLNKALTDLHTHLVNSGIDASQWGAIMTDAFTKKAGAGIITLIGTYDRFEQKYKEVQGGAASFAQDWAATQKTAAFQAAALKDNIDAMVISIGDHLLPVATSTMGFLNGTAVPALEHLGSGAMDVAHWFGELPGPIRDTALALGGLGLANAIGLTDALSSGAGKLGQVFLAGRDSLRAFGDEMAVQQALGAMEATSLSEVDRAFGALNASAVTAAGSLTRAQVSMQSGAFAGWDYALSQTAVAEEQVVTSTGRLSGAMSTIGSRISGAIGSMGFGGWALAIGGSILALKELNDLLGNQYDPTAKIAEADNRNLAAAQDSYTQALKASNGAINENVRTSAAQALQSAGVLDIAQRAKIPLSEVTDAVLHQGNAYGDVKNKLSDYAGAMLISAAYTHSGTDATHQQSQAAQDALNAFLKLAGQLPKNAAAQHQLNEAISGVKSAIDSAKPGLEYAASAAGMSADEIKNANKEWEAWIKTLSGLDAAFADPLTIYENMLSQKQQAEQQSAQATAASTKSSKDSWKNYVQDVQVSLSDYAGQLEAQLKNEEDWHKNLATIAQRAGYDVAQQFADMGVKGADLTAQMANATGDNFTRMANDMAAQAQQGGTAAAANFDTAMRVMAEIGKEGGAATAEAVASQLGIGANTVAGIAQQYGVNLASGINPILAAVGKATITVLSTSTRPGVIGHNADGGYITGPGSGRSDSILSFLSNGEFVINAAATAVHRPLLEAINNSPKFAAGGFVSPADVPLPYSTAPFQFPLSTAANGTMATEYNGVTAWLQQNANNPYLGSVAGATSQAAVQLAARMAAAYGWTGPEWTALFNVGMRESGWNPYAVNASSGAYGIPQALGHGHPFNLGDSGAQIAWMLDYIRGRYGDPIRAWAHEMSAGWYHSGGIVPGPPSRNVPAVLKGGETVRTAEQEAALRGPTQVVLQLDGRATTDLLDGRIVAFSVAGSDRGVYNP